MKAVILVCDLYLMTLANCTERNAVAVFKVHPSAIERTIDNQISPRDTSYRERVKILRK